MPVEPLRREDEVGAGVFVARGVFVGALVITVMPVGRLVGVSVPFSVGPQPAFQSTVAVGSLPVLLPMSMPSVFDTTGLGVGVAVAGASVGARVLKGRLFAPMVMFWASSVI